jgi:biopolymer transport protein TolR
MAFYFSRRKIKPKEEEESTELNIVPYLDILMNLIIFMLLSLTGLATFGILNVNAPSYGSNGAGDPNEKPPLNLTVAIGKKGFYVAGTGGVVGGEAEAVVGGTPGDAPPTIPRNSDGTYNYTALTKMMKDVKASPAGAAESKLILAAEADTQFEVLVATMDATRETEDRKLLFPDITLASF